MQPKASQISSIEKRKHTEEILASPNFRRSKRLSSFLTYIVEETLNGNYLTLKAYTIATEALGMDKDFDPQSKCNCSNLCQ